MGHGDAEVYGFRHLPCRVEVNARLTAAPAGRERKIG